MGVDVGTQQVLRPYVPRLVIDWLRDEPRLETRRIDATLVFADISGFTALTERLARQGKAGAEEMGDLLNATFEQLLGVAYAYGCMLLKWGGDAVLLSFTGDGHPARAARAALAMQRTIRTAGRLQTSVGPVRLGMSIGVHTGMVDAFLADTRHRELLLVGPAATAVTMMEKHAERGQVLLSPSTAQALARAGHPVPTARSGPGVLLDVALDVDPTPSVTPPDIAGVDLAEALDPSLHEHLLGGLVDPEHRHIAVGFVEFAGVDALLRDDEPGPQRALPELRALLARTQDAVAAQRITLLSTDVNADGGKIILVSGAPRATGDDEGRVLAAVQEVMALDTRLRLRAGVNHGPVFASDYGPAYRRVYSVAGDCVNLAARLMASAAPGEIRVMPSVLAASRTRYRVSELPPFAAKGKAEPVRSVRLGRPLEGPAAAPEEHGPLVGRADELGVLRAALAEAADGRGQVVELVGDRGLGKSRLVSEICSTAAVSVLRVRGETYAGGAPYTPWRRLLAERLGVGDDPLAMAAQLRARAGALAPWLPLIGIVAGVQLPATAEVDALDVTFRKARLEHAFTAFLTALVPEPALICFEDLQLLDSASHDLFTAVAAGVGELPWVILGTRTGDGGGRLLGGGGDPGEASNRTRIVLQPLAAADALAFLTASTGATPIAPHRMAAIARRASGNPLYLREIILAVLAGGDPDHLPTSVEQLAAAHVDRLAPADRHVLRTAAVLGDDVAVDLLARLLDGAGPAGADPDLSRLGEFLRPTGRGRFAFVHSMLREVAYEGLPYSRRAVLHARAAEALESAVSGAAPAGTTTSDLAALLSLHYLAAGRYPQAWRHARLAAAQARNQYALADAVTQYRRALAAAEHIPGLSAGDRLDGWEALGDACYDLGDFDEADRAFRRGRRLLGDEPLRSAGLRLRVAKVAERRGELSRALAWLSRARTDLVGLSGPDAGQLGARLAAEYAYVRWLQGRTADAWSWAQRAEREATASGEDRALAVALRVHDLIDLDRGQLDAPPRGLEALRLLRALGDRVGLGHTLVGLGGRAYFRGSWAEAVERYTQARDSFVEAGDQWNAATMSANIAEVRLDQGEDDAALHLLEPAIRIWRANRLGSEIAFGQTLLGRISARSGDLSGALAHLTAARDFYLGSGEKASARFADALRAEAHLLCADPTEALALTDRLAAGDAGSDLWLALVHRVRGEALAELGRGDAARDALAASLEAARARGAAHDVAFALDALLRHALVDGPAVAAFAAERDDVMGRLGIRRRQPVG